MLRLFRSRRSRRSALVEALGGAAPPSFPRLAMQTLKLLRDPNVHLGQVGQIIAADPGMSVAVLKTVNCAAYGLRSRVSSVPHAVNLLGRRQIEGIVLALAVNESMPRNPAGLDSRAFWRLSAERAVLARRIAREIAPESTDLSFTAALLQDMSLPLLCAHREREYRPLLESWSNREANLQAEEALMFGWTHAQVAEWLGEAWHFSEDLLQAIGSHHDSVGGLLPVKLVGLLRDVDDEIGVEELIETLRTVAALDPDQTLAMVRESVEESRELGSLLAG